MRRDLLFVAAFGACAAHASLVVVGNAPTVVLLRIGSPGATVNLVTFNVAAANVGNGVPVTGTVSAGGDGGVCPANHVYFDAEGRATPAASRTITLSADSSTALTNGVQTMGFNQIAWTANAGTFPPVTIPSGTFTGGGGQVLASWPNSNRNRQCLQFTYANTSVFAAGTYNGRVRYTVAMP